MLGLNKAVLKKEMSAKVKKPMQYMLKYNATYNFTVKIQYMSPICLKYGAEVLWLDRERALYVFGNDG
jgi:hypothetical protein